MKLVAVSTLLSFVVLTGCETTQRQTSSYATNDSLEVMDRKADLKLAAEKRLALGLGYVEKGILDRAKRNLLTAEKHDPDNPDVMFGLAYYYQRVLEFEKAEQYYKKAIRMNSNNPNYLNGYGAFLCSSLKRYDDANEYFLKAIAQPEYTMVAETYENAGFCSLEAKKYEDSEMYFRKAMTFNPKAAKPFYGLSKMAFDRQDYNLAERYLLKFEAKSKVTPESLFLGYQIGRRLNDRYSMQSYGEKLTQLFPETEEAILYRRMSNR